MVLKKFLITSLKLSKVADSNIVLISEQSFSRAGSSISSAYVKLLVSEIVDVLCIVCIPGTVESVAHYTVVIHLAVYSIPSLGIVPHIMTNFHWLLTLLCNFDQMKVFGNVT